MQKLILIATMAALSLGCFADTFTNKKSGETFTGFATTRKFKDLTIVKTQEKGTQKLKLSDYDIKQDANGRADQITIIELRNAIEFMAETEAFCKALEKNASRGVKMIIVDVDSPGGSIMMCRIMCKKILEISKICPIVAYISGGEMNGAISAAAGVSMACRDIYMASETTIGAATPWMMTKFGIKEASEEFRQGFSGFYGEVAEKTGKPKLIAMAMVDKDFDVTEYRFDDQQIFHSKTLGMIVPTPKGVTPDKEGKFSFRFPKDAKTHTWTKKGDVMTLSAPDAVETGIATGIIDSQSLLLKELKLGCSKVVLDKSPNKARAGIQKAKKRIDNTIVRIQSRISSFNNTKMTYDQAMGQLTKMSKELRDAIKLSEKYPEMQVNRPVLYELYNQVQAALRH